MSAGTITTAPQTTETAPQGGLSRRLWALLAVILAADALDLMDSTITNIGAPSIVRDLGGGEQLVKWLGAGYALAMGVLLVVGGRLGDRYGRRRLFLVGLSGFIVASLACGLAYDPASITVGRIVQGGFGALLIPQGIGILTTSFPREQMATAFALFGPVLGGAAVAGPLLAGLLIDADLGGLGWRPIFLINLVLGGAALVAAHRVLPADVADRSVTVDAPGSALLGVAMFGAILGLIDGSTDGWGALPIVSLAVAGAAFAAFGARQRVAPVPLIIPSLLRNRGFTTGLLVGLLFFAAANGLAYVASLFLQSALGRTPSQAALALAPMMAGIIVAAFVSRPAIEQLGRRLVFVGLALTLLATAGLWWTVQTAGIDMSAWALAPSLLVLGLGMGACFGSIYDIAVGDVAAEEAGSASGSLSAVQQLAGAIGSAIVTSVYFGQLDQGGATHAMALSVAGVGVIAALCLGPALLLPRRTNPALADG